MNNSCKGYNEAFRGSGNKIHTIKKEISSLSPEGKKKATRRARDLFNKDEDIQLEMMATMIHGGQLMIEDLY